MNPKHDREETCVSSVKTGIVLTRWCLDGVGGRSAVRNNPEDCGILREADSSALNLHVDGADGADRLQVTMLQQMLWQHAFNDLQTRQVLLYNSQ